MALAFSVTARAQNNRSFVATTGDDANNCTATANCRTFTRALSVTNPNGEVVVVNSGGYGSFTITRPVVITAIGVDASIAYTNLSGSAIGINTLGDVTITGLNLSGGGGTGGNGIIAENVGTLKLYNMRIQDFAYYGIAFEQGAALSVYDSTVHGNGYIGLYTDAPTYVENTSFDHNKYAGVMGYGQWMAIKNSSAQFNGIGFDASYLHMLVLDNDAVSFNGVGLQTDVGWIYFAHCVVTGNATAYQINSGTITGSSPGTSLIAPGQATVGSLSTPIALQ